MSKSVHTKLLIVLTAISLTIFLILAFNTQTQWCQDSHWHLSLAKSFSSGDGYSFDGTTSTHGKYPIGLTLLITPFQIITQNIQLAGLIMIGLISIFNIILIYKIGSISDKKIGLLSAAFLVFHNLFIFNMVSVMTELPFMFFSLASIYFFTKGFENNKMFLPSLFFFSIASLIRYDGFFLAPVFLIYTYTKRKQLGNIDLNYLLLGILSVAIFLGGWFIRNWIAFGSPLASSYASELTGFNLMKYVSFLVLFFDLGYIFPILAIIGLYFFLKENNPKLKPYIIWLAIYIVLHMYWSTRVLRFYVEVLGVFCILAAYGVFGIAYKLKLNKNKTIAFISIILVIFIVSQSAIFFMSTRGESGLKTLNRYNSIKEISDYANDNLPENVIYAVSDYAVYNLYLEKPIITDYSEGINLLVKNKTVYILTDTLHSWMTEPFMEGKNGSIKLQLENRKILTIKTDLIFESEYNDHKAIILRPTSLSIN
jgi:hypothetical protein